MSTPRATLGELERLMIQAAAWAAEADRLLERAGVGPGWAIADLGCGPAGILAEASRRVGPAGQVVGVEAAPDRAIAARLGAAAAGLPNVIVRIGDAARTELPAGSFDLAHARFLTQEVDCDQLLTEMVRLVRPGGLIALEEPGDLPWEIDPEPAGYRRIEPLVRARFLARPTAAGSALVARCRRDLSVLDAREVRLELAGGDQYAATPRHALAAAAPALLAAGSADAATLRRADRALRAAARDRAVRHRSFSVVQILARAA
ncbi:MAG: class I SAM-dependent methyltransferase [Gemmatimonadetes bacterium]|nr:class I SAM-dependent methyltransferase [Gemmatimonadota bacterium]